MAFERFRSRNRRDHPRDDSYEAEQQALRCAVEGTRRGWHDQSVAQLKRRLEEERFGRMNLPVAELASERPELTYNPKDAHKTIIRNLFGLRQRSSAALERSSNNLLAMGSAEVEEDARDSRNDNENRKGFRKWMRQLIQPSNESKKPNRRLWSRKVQGPRDNSVTTTPDFPTLPSPTATAHTLAFDPSDAQHSTPNSTQDLINWFDFATNERNDVNSSPDAEDGIPKLSVVKGATEDPDDRPRTSEDLKHAACNLPPQPVTFDEQSHSTSTPATSATCSTQSFPSAERTENTFNSSKAIDVESHSTEYSDSGTESSSSSDESLLCSFDGHKKVLLDRLMKYFYSVVSPSVVLSPIVQSPSGHDRNGRASPDRNASGGVPSGVPSLWTKPESKRLPDDLDGETSGGGEGQKRACLGLSEDGDIPRLACPYFKKNPQRYCSSKWRSCIGPGWETVHRVKEHLYRCHSLPITCPRCHDQFGTEALRNSHLTAEERCPVRSKPDIEGFDSVQKEQLRSRKKKDKKPLTEADKWRDVYLILFPDTGLDAIPSPYLDVRGNANASEAESAVNRYEQFMRRELPRMVRQELKDRIERVFEPLEETLKSEIVDIVRDAQLALFQKFVSADPQDSNQGSGVWIDDGVLSSSAGEEPASNTTTWELNGQLEAFRPTPNVEGGLLDFGDLPFGLDSELGHQVQHNFLEASAWEGSSSSGQQAISTSAISFPDDWNSVFTPLSSLSHFNVNDVNQQAKEGS